MRNYLMGLAMVTMLSSGCMGFEAKVLGTGDDNSKKESNFGVNTKVKASAKVDAEITGVKAKKMDNTGVKVEKTENYGDGVDMKTLKYLLGLIFGLMTGLVTKMFIQLAAKDQIILDLGNDAKEILLKIMPMFILMHDKESYREFMTLKAEYEAAVDIKVKEALSKKKGWFGRKNKENK